MSLFGKSSAVVAVVDVRSSSIGAAYVMVAKDAAPAVVYSVRIPIDPHATEPLEEALPRTLEAVLTQLVSQGAPLLHKAAGSGKADRVLVTLSAPWQRSRVFSRVIEKDRPFVFTQQALDATEEHTEEEKGYTGVSRLAIATLLNGYEVANPFGKRANRAEVIMLSSSVADSMREMVEKLVRKALHQHHIEFNAFMPEAYAVLRDIYPHQHDFLVLDIGNEATDILLVKHGLLISTSFMPHGVGEMARAARGVGLSSPAVPIAATAPPLINVIRNTSFATKVEEAEAGWLAEVHTALGEVAKQEPLPRTIFLLAEENVRDFLKRLLDSPTLRNLWLSDEALAILPILPLQFAPFLSSVNAEGVDPALALLALAAGKRST